jgi:hypothetical protein
MKNEISQHVLHLPKFLLDSALSRVLQSTQYGNRAICSIADRFCPDHGYGYDYHDYDNAHLLPAGSERGSYLK